jgi:hypothetical protein
MTSRVRQPPAAAVPLPRLLLLAALALLQPRPAAATQYGVTWSPGQSTSELSLSLGDTVRFDFTSRHVVASVTETAHSQWQGCSPKRSPGKCRHICFCAFGGQHKSTNPVPSQEIVECPRLDGAGGAFPIEPVLFCSQQCPMHALFAMASRRILCVKPTYQEAIAEINCLSTPAAR